MRLRAGFALGALAGVALGALSVGSATAADLAIADPVVTTPSIFDVAFGVAGVTDYRWRGIAQSKKDPAVQGYAELQLYDLVYAGVWASSVNLPERNGLTDPSAEIDLYGGLRHTFDNGIGLDVGGLYYWYPGEQRRNAFTGLRMRETDWWELYAKPSYTWGPLTIAAQASWSTDFFNTGANSFYLAALPKISIPVNLYPGVGLYVSGEVGKQWIKRTTAFAVNQNPKDYWNWNVGAGVTYKAMTLDVRYSDTNMSKNDCAFYGSRNWCGSAVIGKISFDTTLNKLQ